MFASLVGDPAWLTIPALADLTDRQIADLYFAERDDNRNVKRRLPEVASDPLPEDAPTPENYARALWSMVGNLGVTEESVREAFARKFPGVPMPGREGG